jgi:hypothetical protein
MNSAHAGDADAELTVVRINERYLAFGTFIEDLRLAISRATHTEVCFNPKHPLILVIIKRVEAEELKKLMPEDVYKTEVVPNWETGNIPFARP